MTKKFRQSRFRLGELDDDQYHYFHAVFCLITHKKSGRAVILLKDLYLVDKNDKKIAMRKASDQVDKYGRHIIADHVWINLTKPWLETKNELFDGDEVMFKAKPVSYKIVRNDVLQKREEIYQAAVKKCDKLEAHWRKETAKGYVKDFDQKLKALQDKKHKILARAKEEQNNIELVDYSLKNISSIKVVKYKKLFYHTERGLYNPNRYNDEKYTKYLAWHSIDYAEKRGDYKKNRY